MGKWYEQRKRRRVTPMRDVHHSILHIVSVERRGEWVEVNTVNIRPLVQRGLIETKPHPNEKLTYVRLKEVA